MITELLDKNDIERVISDVAEEIIGDTPVSVQLAMVIDKMAEKEHTHDEYATRDEVEELKNKINMLIDLVGDTPVSEQIYAAIKNI